MATLKDRQRAAARARLEREMAARQAEARRRRKNRLIAAASAFAVIVVVGAVVLVVQAATGGKPTPTATETLNAPAKCTWTPNPALKGTGGAQKDPDLIDTGVPPTGGAATTGTRDMVMDTNYGKITITLDLPKSPCAAESMLYLASKKFFNNTNCHRLTTEGIYILQCGDPSGKGDGGPGYTFAHEYLPTNERPNYPRGVVAMANPSDEDKNGSQFFIVYKDTPETLDQSGNPQSNLAPNYTVIGTVTGGMNIVDKVAAGGAKPADPNGNTAPKIPLDVKAVTIGPVKL